MNTTTIAVDLAKNVFQAHFTDEHGHVKQRKRITRHQFQKLLVTSPTSTVVMEACATAHHWGRIAEGEGHTAVLLPAQHVKPYVRNNKTDSADADGLLRAYGDKALKPVPLKSEDLQAIQGLHRVRQKFENQRKALMNLVRGLLKEFGHVMPLGKVQFKHQVAQHIEQVPLSLQASLTKSVAQVDWLDDQVQQIERELKMLSKHNAVVQHLMRVPGVGLLTSTALYAAIPDIHRYRSGRAFSSSLGIVPRVISSGESCYLGPITKRGNKYLRMLLVHGARSVMIAARVKSNRGQSLTRLEDWALDLATRVGHNKACVGVANKLARIIWAVWSKGEDYRS